MTRPWLLRVAAMAAAAAALTGAAQAKTGVTTISHMAMTVDGRNENVGYSAAFNGGVLTVREDAPGARCFSTSVAVPPGAKPSKLRVWGSGKANGGLLVNFSVLDVVSGQVTTLFNRSKGDNSGERKQIVASLAGAAPATIKSAFSLGVCLDPGESFSGARVEYVVN